MRVLLSKIKAFIFGTYVMEFIYRIAFVKVSASTSGYHVLLAAPGMGNIGDEAMLEAFVKNVRGEVAIVVRSDADYPTASIPAKVTHLPSLFYGSPFRAALDIWRYARIVRGARSVSLVGADIMDGAYSADASVRRALAVKYAARSGANARVLGFSWNENPASSALKSLKAAARAGVLLFPRDPASAARLTAAGCANLEQTSDIVFTSSDTTPLPTEISIPGNDFAVVNASSFVARGVDSTQSYIELIDSLHSFGLHVVLLPHVVRDGGDPTILREIYDSLGDDQKKKTLLIDRKLAPAQVRFLASKARLVVTGRMHLSVMSLRLGTPTAVVGTQGKVEGMMEMFGIKHLVVSPASISNGGLIEAATILLRDHDILRERIAATLPQVVSRAERNFSGLR